MLTRVVGRSNDVIRTPGGKVSVHSFASCCSSIPGCVSTRSRMSDYSLLVKVVPVTESMRAEDLDPLCRSLGKQKTVASHLP